MSDPADNVPDVTEVEAPPSLSPSRAADFKSCPLLYRFRCVDRLPQAPSRVATRGTLVHSVLEALFELPADQRTAAAAQALLPAEWARLREQAPEVETLFAGEPEEFAAWLATAGRMLDNYFRVEDPAAFEPRSREQLVEVDAGGVRLRGYVDRVDDLDGGRVRVVDYKSGFAPGVDSEARVLFQLKFYALVLWRTTGVVPGELRLIYLSDPETLTYEPSAAELERFEGVVLALWAAIAEALRTGDFRPSPGPQCEWCDFRSLCPAFGGVPPPYPERPVLVDPREFDPTVRSP